MLTDFAKIETFLMVVREKSFSKASAKLGVSQPAVTQQIGFIEKYLDTRIVERKKNGIKVTKEGAALLAIALKLEKSVNAAERELLKILNKDITFILGASSVVGKYIIPRFLKDLKQSIHNDMIVEVKSSEQIIEDLLNKNIDVALVDNYIPRENIVYREWTEEEIVIFSNQKLPAKVKPKDLLSYKWVCRGPESNTRSIFKESLEKINYPDCDTYQIENEVSSSTAIIQTILHSSKDDTPTTSVVSRSAIEMQLKSGELFESRLPNMKMKNKLYIAYRKDRKYDALIENVVDYLFKIKK